MNWVASALQFGTFILLLYVFWFIVTMIRVFLNESQDDIIDNEK